MDIKKLTENLKQCPCGREHRTDIEDIIIESGAVKRVGKILKNHSFAKSLLLVADKNTIKAAEGIVENLENEGFILKLQIYDDLRIAKVEEVDFLRHLLHGLDGIISVGTGSNNDICRRAAFLENKDFCIFATAPSMDGFASDTSPIITGNFKDSQKAKQPRIIIADTKILADAPSILKSAGFGDMIAKFVAIVDWRISNLVIGEYFCPVVCDLTREAVNKICSFSHKITSCDEEAAKAVFEALIMTGIVMGFTGNSRPASGTEHVLSHFWECKKLQTGEVNDFHGRKVAVATLEIAKIYHSLNVSQAISSSRRQVDIEEILSVFGEELEEEVRLLNKSPVINEVDPEKLQRLWPNIISIIKEELPSPDELELLLKNAGAPTTKEEIGVNSKLFEEGIRYHTYMRNRLSLLRLLILMGKIG